MFMHTRCLVDDILRSVALWMYYNVAIIGRPMIDALNKDPFRVWQDTGE